MLQEVFSSVYGGILDMDSFSFGISFVIATVFLIGISHLFVELMISLVRRFIYPGKKKED